MTAANRRIRVFPMAFDAAASGLKVLSLWRPSDPRPDMMAT